MENGNDLLLSLLPNLTNPLNYDKQIDLDGLSEGQCAAINSVLNGENILLTGPAGTGKSFTIEKIKQIFTHKLKKTIGITSTTGASAILIGGRTIHSWSGIGICGSKESALKRVMTYAKPQARIEATSLLIIDEVSMMPSHVLDILNYVFKIVRRCSMPFGGIQVVLVGDFYQLSPVLCDKYAFEAECWSELIHKVHELDFIFRQDNKNFCIALNEIRIADVSLKTIELLAQCIHKEFKGDIKPTELYPIKANVSEVNEYELWELITEENRMQEFGALDELIEKPKPKRPTSDRQLKGYRERMNKDCIAPQILQLCIGAQVMLIHNLNVEAGLANGSRGIVIKFTEQGQPIVKFMNGHIVTIGTHVWYKWMNETTRYKRTQYPLILAWAITIHKVQGATLDLLKVDLGSTNFCDGQVYTAISRAKTLEGLSIIAIDWDKIIANKKVKDFYNSYKKK